MHVLVLDTVHGGNEISAAYRVAGHEVDAVDIYHGTTPDLCSAALHRDYDLIAAPVHLDPDHALLVSRKKIPVITHHEAVRRLLGDRLPHPMVEITGAIGKTTTAHALAHILPGKGVLHTSAGTFICPDGQSLFRKSITPASVIPAVREANRLPGWLVAEVSLGVTGAADLSIITSPEDYPIASGKKSAIREKIASVRHAKKVLVADGVSVGHPGVVRLGDVARCDGTKCTVAWEGREYDLDNPLFLLPPYRTPLMLAAAAAAMLQVSPEPLNTFTALPGRMSVSRERGLVIVDNSNSGTNESMTVCAARYARHCAGTDELTLVIGQPEGDGAVCEGFAPDQIASAIVRVKPAHVIWVGRCPGKESGAIGPLDGKIDAFCATLEEGREAALRIAGSGSVVLAVKTWR